MQEYLTVRWKPATFRRNESLYEKSETSADLHLKNEDILASLLLSVHRQCYQNHEL